MIRIVSPHTRRKARIEIIPLIDIVFFLLATFVMVSMSMVKNQGLAVKLPQSQTSTPLDRAETVTVTVTRDGAYLVGKEHVTQDELQGRLEELRREKPQVSIIVNGDEGAEFGTAVHALDEIRRSGINKVSIQTRKANS